MVQEELARRQHEAWFAAHPGAREEKAEVYGTTVGHMTTYFKKVGEVGKQVVSPIDRHEYEARYWLAKEHGNS